MNGFLRTGLIMTVALAAVWAQDYGQTPPPAPPRAGISGGVIGGIPGGVTGGIPGRVTGEIVGVVAPEEMEPPEAAEPPEPLEPMEPLEAPEVFEPPEALEPPEPAEPPEPGFAPRVEATLAFALQTPPPPAPPPPSAAPKIARSGEDDSYYERGQRDLERNRWDDAVSKFGEVVARGGPRADGALYWKAYALNRLGRRDDALAAIGELRKSYAGSRWLDDARALEIEVKQASGKTVNPESADDEELKLMALNSFMNSDPDRALPLLEKLLHSSQSPKIKERALFVLTQSGSPQARHLVVQMAKGGSNPDLQMAAVHYLGVMGAHQELGDVYAATNDAEVKRAVLHGLMVAGAKEQLLAAAKSEKSADLRQQAIHWLGTMGAEPELWQLYQAEPSVEVKRAIMHALFIGGKTEHLVEIARTAKEPELRQDSIHWLGVSGSHRAGDALGAMYATESDANVKKQIIQALFVQNNGRALVEIARKETNIELKKEIVHRLSMMKSKEGTDYLLELLNK
jgi:tetratricopeptide (TPR) repeat protein